MLGEINEYLNEIEIILKEIESYESFKKRLLKDLKILYQQYEAGRYDYARYKKIREKILRGKTKKDVLEYFNSIILSLTKKIEYLNAQLFTAIYKEEPEKRKVEAQKKTVRITLPKHADKEKPSIPGMPIDLKETLEVAQILAKKPAVKTKGAPLELKEEGVEKAEIIKEEAKPKKDLKSVDVSDVVDEAVETIRIDSSGVPKPLERRPLKAPVPKKKSFWQVVKAVLAGKRETDVLSEGKKGFGFASILSFQFLRDFIRRIREKEEYIGPDTHIEYSLLDFHNQIPADFEEDAKAHPNLLVKQATQLKELLKHRHIKIYNPSMMGTVANLSVRRLSIFLIDNFQEFFKRFYVTLRFANIKVLSNTYVNIMVFLSLLFAIVFGIASTLFSIAQNNPIYLIVSKAFFMAIVGAVLVAGFLIYYPHVKIKERMRSMNTNLPFAIDHMSSLVASGVPPATMFRLLTQSKDYGDVSLEIEKISNFIDVFGYDLLTAIKSISATTPAPALKEFFDGLVSTIESGGDLKHYLIQKSKESMLTYRLERQKYVESISTYSDIYTGVLIAAPLFFVSALSLISMLGGKIGGYDVETVIAFGTYLIIPALNVAFIVFLEFNQPEI